MKRSLESQSQRAVIKWARIADYMIPELSLLHAIPNGAHVSDAHRKRLVSEGLLSGVPDLFLPIARLGYHGLYIEMKSETGRLSKQQKEIIEKLEHQGFLVIVCRSSHEAIDKIEWYLQCEL